MTYENDHIANSIELMSSKNPPITDQNLDWQQQIAQPRQVLLFSGHRVDDADRAEPRFPLTKVPIAKAAIAQVLADLDAGPKDLALTQGASGGDLLFAEACQARGVPVQLMLPLAEAEFLEQSVLPAQGNWLSRYAGVKQHLALPIQSLPKELEIASGDPFVACNEWLLATALAYGAEKLRFVCLWNGSGGDGPGGTAHMVGQVKRNDGQVIWLDTRALW